MDTGFRRVMVCVPVLSGPGGVANYYRVIRQYLKNNEWIDFFEIGGKQRSLIGAFFAILSEPFQFLLAMWNGRYNVVHLNPSVQPRALVRNAVLSILAKLAGKKVIIFWRGWDKKVENRMIKPFQRIFKWIFNKCEVHLVLATEFRDNLREIGIKKPILVTSTIADPPKDFFRISNKELKSGSRLLFMSRLVKAKGVYETIEAFRFLKAEFPLLSLDVAGDGPELPDLKTKYYGLDGLIFHGHIKDKPKYDLLAQSDIFVFPTSHGEGMPNCVLEAMSAGLPVVTTPAGGLKDFFLNGIHGFILNHTDPVNIAQPIHILLKDEKLRRKISIKNHNFAQFHFTAETTTNFLLKVYLASFENRFDNLKYEWFK